MAELNGQHVKLVRVEGDKVPWHRHDDEDELFWVLEGELDVMTRDETVTLLPGSFTVVPKGVEHRFVNSGSLPVTILSAFAPPELPEGAVKETRS